MTLLERFFFPQRSPSEFSLIFDIHWYKTTYICPSHLEYINFINTILICVAYIVYTVPGDTHHDCRQHEENNYVFHLSTSVMKNWYQAACLLTSSCGQSTFSLYHSAKYAYVLSAILLYKKLFFKLNFLYKSSALFLPLLNLISIILFIKINLFQF